ncbi:MAG TPA: hypothetical protein VD788_17605 [Candidatus Polarisedimenticolaceae bacterium]|nr:hypothetical protein [Candidatus Polarisedimenticolaceae bacterium]
MFSTTEQLGRARNPNRLLERLSHASARLRERHGVLRLELFHRGSDTVRVTRRRGRRAGLLSFGRDDGVAVRLLRRGEDGIRFAAVSGHDEEAFDEAVRCALDHGAASRTVSDHWADRTDPLLDHATGFGPPSRDELVPWLDRAVRGFVEARCAGDPDVVEQAWVEAAATVETWAVDGRPAASRTRKRGWACLERAAGDGIGWRRPLLTAAARWDEIDGGAWIRFDEQREAPIGLRAAIAGGHRTLVFTPETSATLVSALIRFLAASRAPGRTPVGAGLRVWDAPDDPDALFGGRFDDSGLEARRKLLADGNCLCEPIDGAGHDRRPSFRDPPQPMPSQLLVEPDPVEWPDGSFRVNRLSIQPLDTDRWVLDVGGVVEGGSVSQAFVPTGPSRLVAACSGGWGEAEASHRAVRTPFLVFDGLAVRC